MEDEKDYFNDKDLDKPLSWEDMIAIIKIMGNEPSPGFLYIMEAEKSGRITKEMIATVIKELSKENEKDMWR